MLDTNIISLFDISLMFIEKDIRGERGGLNQKTLKKIVLTHILHPLWGEAKIHFLEGLLTNGLIRLEIYLTNSIWINMCSVIQLFACNTSLVFTI